MAEANGDARRSAAHTEPPPLSLLHRSLLYFTTLRFTLIHNKQADFGLFMSGLVHQGNVFQTFRLSLPGAALLIQIFGLQMDLYANSCMLEWSRPPAEDLFTNPIF